MSATHDTFVFRKANALASRMRFEKNKKEAAHIICERLIALLNLGTSNGRSRTSQRP